AQVIPTSGSSSEVERTLILSLYCSLLNTSTSTLMSGFSSSKSDIISFTILCCCAELPSGHKCINSTVLLPSEPDPFDPVDSSLSPVPTHAARIEAAAVKTNKLETAFLV